MQIVAQVLGALGIISMILSVQFNSKKQVLGFQIAANSLFAFQYLCLNAISAVVMSFVAALRCIVFFLFENKGKKVPIWVLGLFLLLIIVLFIFFKHGIIGVFPLICTFIYTIGIWQKNLNVFRVITLITASLWIGYNVYYHAYPSLVGNVFEVITSLIAIYRFNLDDTRKKVKIK